MITSVNKVKILNENVDKQSEILTSFHVELKIFGRLKLKARSRVWIVQNNLLIAETLT